MTDENLRTEMPLDAQNRAQQLFGEIERSGMIRAGVGERTLSDEIRDLAAEMFGVERHWHKRIVRAEENTLEPYRENPPDRPTTEDDIVFCDLGPSSIVGKPTSVARSCSATTSASTLCPTTCLGSGRRGGSISTRTPTSRAPGSDHPMRRTDRTGRVCHWILEVHLTDPVRRFGGFNEELLDIR
jgi:Metallopeptidase family M24